MLLTQIIVQGVGVNAEEVGKGKMQRSFEYNEGMKNTIDIKYGLHVPSPKIQVLCTQHEAQKKTAIYLLEGENCVQHTRMSVCYNGNKRDIIELYHETDGTIYKYFDQN